MLDVQVKTFEARLHGCSLVSLEVQIINKNIYIQYKFIIYIFLTKIDVSKLD